MHLRTKLRTPWCCSHIITKTEEKSLQVKEQVHGQSFTRSPAPTSMFLRSVNYAHLGSSSDSSEPPPTSLVWISLGPCRISSHSFLKSLLCAYFEVFCEGKMSKTNQNLCSLLTNSARFFHYPACQRTPLEWSVIAFHACHVRLIVSLASYGEPRCRRSTEFLCPSRCSRHVFTFHCPFLHQWQQWQGRI